MLGHPVLRASVEAVDFPVSEAIRSLVADMLETLRDANGVGIAAPQVYESMAIFIVASRPNPRYPMRRDGSGSGDQPRDPRAVDGDGQRLGGLSQHPRHSRRSSPAQANQGPVSDARGQSVEREFGDFVARIFQHEDDHLHGIVFLIDWKARPRSGHGKGVSKANGDLSLEAQTTCNHTQHFVLRWPRVGSSPSSRGANLESEIASLGKVSPKTSASVASTASSSGRIRVVVRSA